MADKTDLGGNIAAPAAEVPRPGSPRMPPWGVADLPPPPTFTWSSWLGLIGPGLLMAGAAIGGGEWLMGPMVTARYGGSMMWLATTSILLQMVYNVEISRYTLYSGEPIFTGKFRTRPGPWFWLPVYILLDFGAFFPYLAGTAAAPVAAMVLGRTAGIHDEGLLRSLGIAVFLLCILPLLFGGKVYNSLKVLVSIKVVVVFGFLLVVAIAHSSLSTWLEIGRGLFQFGNLPTGGGNVENVFVTLFSGRGFPQIDTSAIPALTTFAAIAGLGGLTNTPVSSYTRDQGWGMGAHVGAIASVFGGHKVALSHVGKVFIPSPETMPRWRRWVRHVFRDQALIWAPACIAGVALPSMMSIQFLPRGATVKNVEVPVMTANALRDHVAVAWGPSWGELFWFLTLLCGFLTLAVSMACNADGFIRRWVDLCWTASSGLRQWDPRMIRWLYFGVLSVFAISGIFMLCVQKPMGLLVISTTIGNFALGFSSFHALVINLTLLPPPLRPGWASRVMLVLAGCFYTLLGTLTTLNLGGFFAKAP